MKEVSVCTQLCMFLISLDMFQVFTIRTANKTIPCFCCVSWAQLFYIKKPFETLQEWNQKKACYSYKIVPHSGRFFILGDGKKLYTSLTLE